ncbi:MAG: CcdB family protein [Magnetococcales bacterium]|nr:CcdB family protein [Magnetococcales bacterium]
MSTPELAGIHRRQLGARVDSLAQARDEIVAARDLLITGF